MKLLIDYLEEAAAYLREKKARLQKLEDQFRRIYDRDIKKEMADIKREINRKNLEVTTELLFNLEEFRALHKYFGDLLSVYMEDDCIGKVLSRKSWLLDFKPLPPSEAAMRLRELKAWRAQLKDAKKFLKGWSGTVEAKPFVATYPVLKGHMTADVDKIDAIAVIDKTDRILLREGWLLLISDSLIHIPLSKYASKISKLKYDELMAKNDYARSRGKGTVAETVALRKLQEITKRRNHYETSMIQILLSNPGYLNMLKKKKDWLSRDRTGTLEQVAKKVTPHVLKERVWLDEMRKRLGVDEAAEAKKSAGAGRPKARKAARGKSAAG